MINQEFTLEGKIAAMRQRQKEWSKKYHSNSENIPASSFSKDYNKGFIASVAEKIVSKNWLAGLL